MPFRDRISHAAAVTKWKADQQMRLLRSQGQVRELENQIKAQKAALADTALTLHAQGQLGEDALKEICAAIATLHGQIEEQQNLQEAIKSERQPCLQAYSADYPPAQPAQMPTESTSGLVCPQCNRPLVGHFCPEHGVEGIPKPSEQAAAISTKLVCPVCSQPLDVRFCPEHGVEGVPLE